MALIGTFQQADETWSWRIQDDSGRTYNMEITPGYASPIEAARGAWGLLHNIPIQEKTTRLLESMERQLNK